MLDAGSNQGRRCCSEAGSCILMLVQVPKSGLMGFGNCAHEEDKHLRVQFLWHQRPHVATLSDQVHSPPHDAKVA